MNQLRGIACLIVALYCLTTSPSTGGEFSWNQSNGGSFSAAGNWLLVNGDGTAPPSDNDTAIFNDAQASAFTVTFSQSATNAHLRLLAGDVTFAPDLADLASYELAQDMTVNAGRLTLSEAGNGQLSVNVLDDLHIERAGTLMLNQGVELSADAVLVGSNPSIAEEDIDGTLVITGADASLVARAISLHEVASVSISDGGQLSSLSANLALSHAHDVDVTIAGSSPSQTPSMWTVDQWLFVGSAGRATVSLSDGAHLSSTSAFIGNQATAQGAVQLTGEANNGVATRWSANALLYVGASGTGELTLDDGAVVESAATRVASSNGSQGTTRVSGVGSSGNASRWTTNELAIGFAGTASLQITDGGQVNSSLGFVGNQVTGDGTVTVSGIHANGNRSTWSTTSDLYVGFAGTGVLDINDGAIVSNTLEAVVGQSPGGTGTVTLSGTAANGMPSQWTSSVLTVALSGTGRLEIRDGAWAESVAGGVVGNAIGSDGQVTVTGSDGAGNPSRWSTQIMQIGVNGLGHLIVEDGGQVTQTLANVGANSNGEGHLRVVGDNSLFAADRLYVGGNDVANGGIGSVTVQSGGQLQVDQFLRIWDQGTVTLGQAGEPVTVAPSLGGRIEAGGQLTGYGTIDSPDDINLPLVNNGQIQGLSDSERLTLAGYVTGIGSLDRVTITGTDSPGISTASVSRGSVDYDGKLVIEISGTTAGEDFDHIDHALGAGMVTIGGELDIDLIGGFEPSPNDTFEIIRAIGGVAGRFTTPVDQLIVPGPGLGWQIDYGTNSVTLSIVAAEVRGDFNNDGFVDAIDIDLLSTALRDNSVDLQFDLDASGAVDPNDRLVMIDDVVKTWFGDSNLDGEFNSDDLLTVFAAGQYEDDTPGNSGWATGDWDGDGDFTTDDLITALAGGGYLQGPRSTAGAVPEPRGIVLAMLGLIGLARWRRAIP